MIRIGFGCDTHRLEEKRDLWLGGIKIPHYKGAIGHSDADVLIHSICDALLGAANLGDIGTHFPDTSSEFKNIDSKLLLGNVINLINDMGFTIVNIDTTICLENPKLAPYIPQMKKILAETMQISTEDISIKAKTSEKLGFVGREEGVTAYATSLIEKK